MRTDEKEKAESVDTPPAPRKEKPKKEKREKPPKKEKIRGAFKATLAERLRSRTVIGFIIIIVALLIAFVAFPIVQGIISERVPVVVAAVDIERGTYLTAEHFRVSEMGAVDRPNNAATSIDQVVGAYAGMDLLSGDIITSAKVRKDIPLSNPYLYELPEGKVALSITVKGLAEGLTGKLKEGDIVSVYAVFSKSDAEEDYNAMQPPELKYMKVLAISNAGGTDIDVDDPNPTEETDTETLPATITLMAGDYQAAALAGLDKNATIYVGLVARSENTELCEELLLTQDNFVEKLEKELNGEEEESSSEEVSVPPEESSTDSSEASSEEESSSTESSETESSEEVSNG